MKSVYGAFTAALMFVAIPALAQDNTTTTQPPAANTQTEQTQTTVPVTPTDPSTSSTTTTDQTATTTNQMATGDMWYTTQNNEMRASKFIGTSVYNANNERIGEVNEVLLDNTGKVAAVIIGVGGFLGLGERDVAVAYNSIQMKPDNNGAPTLMINTTKEALTAAPAWTWPRS
jgi:sporulation protein YlmC with PRC-barrel domain